MAGRLSVLTYLCALLALLPPPSPARHLQVSGGGVFRGAPAQLPGGALRGGTHQTSHCLQEDCGQETLDGGGGRGGELGLRRFRLAIRRDATAAKVLRNVTPTERVDD